MSRGTYNNWLNLIDTITVSLLKGNQLHCPVCGDCSIDFQYVGDVETKFGYLDVWCNECLIGIHISRTNIPDKMNVLPFSTPKDEIMSRRPNFKQVTP
jgi:hypothetical protein